MTRARAQDLLEFRTHARSVQKACRRYADALRTLVGESDALTGEMERLAKGQACLTGRYGNYIAKTLSVVNANRRLLAASLDTLCDTAMAVFVDFDFQEVADVKKRRERAGPDAAALEPRFARLVAELGEKRDTRFLRALAHVAHLHRAFFDVGGKLAGTLNNKMTDLAAHLAALDAAARDRPTKEGIVYRRGGERVFFVLRGGTLHMLREGRDYAPDSELDMMTTSVKTPQVADDEDWKDHCRFELNSLRLVRPVVVYTTTAAERAEWVKVLQDAIASKINSLSIAGDAAAAAAAQAAASASAGSAAPGGGISLSSSSSSSSGTDGAGSDEPCGNSGTGASASATGAEDSGGSSGGGGGEGCSVSRRTELHGTALSEETIAAVRACGGNGVCAECGAPAPEWAVLNFGILICLECSGVHRSLGTHISRVRSLALDRWTPEAVLLLTHIGNARHNAVYEAALAPPAAKPGPASDRAARDAFIRAKYQQRRFVARTADDTPAAGAAALLRAAGDADQPRALAGTVRALAAGADPNCTDPADRAPPLFRAVAAGHVLVLEALVQNGASTVLLDARGWSALHHAAYYNRPRCAHRLLQCPRPPVPTVPPADVARWNGAPEAAAVLSGAGAAPADLTLDAAVAPDVWVADTATPPHSTVLPAPDVAARIPALLQQGQTNPPAPAQPRPTRAAPRPPDSDSVPDAPPPAGASSSPASPSASPSPPLRPSSASTSSLPPSPSAPAAAAPVAPGFKMLAVPMLPGKQHQLKRARAPGSPSAERRGTGTGTGTGTGDGAAKEPPKGGVAVLPACPQGQRPWGAAGRPAPASAGPVRRATVSRPPLPQQQQQQQQQQAQTPGAGTPLQQRRLSQQLSRSTPKPLPVPQPRARQAEAAPAPEEPSVSMELDALASFLAAPPPQAAPEPRDSGGGSGGGSAAGTGTKATADVLKTLSPGQDTDAQLADFSLALQSIDDVLGNLQTLTF